MGLFGARKRKRGSRNFRHAIHGVVQAQMTEKRSDSGGLFVYYFLFCRPQLILQRASNGLFQGNYIIH